VVYIHHHVSEHGSGDLQWHQLVQQNIVLKKERKFHDTGNESDIYETTSSKDR
jgi:hypothetical protein